MVKKSRDQSTIALMVVIKKVQTKQVVKSVRLGKKKKTTQMKKKTLLLLQMMETILRLTLLLKVTKMKMPYIRKCPR